MYISGYAFRFEYHGICSCEPEYFNIKTGRKNFNPKNIPQTINWTFLSIREYQTTNKVHQTTQNQNISHENLGITVKFKHLNTKKKYKKMQ